MIIGRRIGDFDNKDDKSSLCDGCLANCKGRCAKAHMLSTRYDCTEAVYIGMRCEKKSGRPFKSQFRKATIKGIIDHPELGVPAYVFFEDDSYVECSKVKVIAGEWK